MFCHTGIQKVLSEEIESKCFYVCFFFVGILVDEGGFQADDGPKLNTSLVAL